MPATWHWSLAVHVIPEHLLSVGATVTVPLNSLGRKLLARFHRLPLRLTVTLTSRQAPAAVIKAAGVVIKPRASHRRRHH